jgi:hypothetical protein
MGNVQERHLMLAIKLTVAQHLEEARDATAVRGALAHQ